MQSKMPTNTSAFQFNFAIREYEYEYLNWGFVQCANDCTDDWSF